MSQFLAWISTRGNMAAKLEPVVEVIDLARDKVSVVREEIPTTGKIQAPTLLKVLSSRT
jgi:hypothetical protein